MAIRTRPLKKRHLKLAPQDVGPQPPLPEPGITHTKLDRVQEELHNMAVMVFKERFELLKQQFAATLAPLVDQIEKGASGNFQVTDDGVYFVYRTPERPA